MGYTKNILYDARILVIGRVGTHGIVQRLWSKCWPSDNTLIITSDYYEFVYQVLRTINYKNINRGTTQPLITQTDMKNISIITPHKSNILQFECVIAPLFKVITHNTLETRTLAAIRDSLLPRLMSGEIKAGKSADKLEKERGDK
jgi:type I restriction enzyme S subunit